MNNLIVNFNNKYELLMKYATDIKNVIYNTPNLKHIEGNYFTFTNDENINKFIIHKQINIFNLGYLNDINYICEIGFNAGHSAMLMLLGRNKSPIVFTIFDINHHVYTKPTFEYIKNEFNHINFEFIEGNSIITIPEWINKYPNRVGIYDLIHVDGGHTKECIENDMKNASILIKTNGIIVIDDTNDYNINKCVDDYLVTGKYVELFLLPMGACNCPHRIIKKLI